MKLKKEKTDATKKKGMALSDDALENVTGESDWYWVKGVNANGEQFTNAFEDKAYATSWAAETAGADGWFVVAASDKSRTFNYEDPFWTDFTPPC